MLVLEGINPPRGITQSNMSIPDFADWQNQNQVFEHMAGFIAGGVLLNNGDETERVHGTAVTADFFTLFRTPSLLGRTLQPDDAQAGRDPVSVIVYSLWQSLFVANSRVIGSKAMMSAKHLTIVCGMPHYFDD